MWYTYGDMCAGVCGICWHLAVTRCSEVSVTLISGPVKEMAFCPGIQGHLPASSLCVPSHFRELSVLGSS